MVSVGLLGTPDSAVSGSIAPNGADTQPATPANSERLCIEHCKFDNKAKRNSRQLEMIECSMCAIWFHTACVGVKQDVPVGVWPCLSCRLIPAQARNLLDTTNAVNMNLAALSDSYDRLSTLCETKNQECDALKGTRHKQNSLSGNTLFNNMPTYTPEV